MPNYNIGVGSASPASQISTIMSKLERILTKEKPELTDEIREALTSAIDEFIKTIKKEESSPAETSS